ncbi:MAG: ribose-5-phosphate isomerase RpiA [Phycisphaerales bacterium]|nr:ribose-5-phosphate isomerase RpiA [Phycisphaerales bacterium]
MGDAAAQLIEPGQIVGLGSGRASHAFVRALAARLAREKFTVLGIPTSNSTEKLARELGIAIGSLETVSTIDIAVDGADEVTPEFDLLKGGGGDLLREKVVASISRRFVIVVGHEKLVPCLGDKFPVFIEVVAFALPVVVRCLQTLGGQAAPRLTPDGNLFLTDNGNPLLHAIFGPKPHHISNPKALATSITNIPGVVGHGMFLSMATDLFVAKADGSIAYQQRPSKK